MKVLNVFYYLERLTQSNSILKGVILLVAESSKVTGQTSGLDYDKLFRELLQQESMIYSHVSKAAETYYVNYGHDESVLNYFLETNKRAQLEILFKHHYDQVYRTGNLDLLKGLISLVPQSYICTSPLLCMIQGDLNLLGGKVTEARQSYTSARKILNQDDKKELNNPLEAEIWLRKAIAERLMGFSRSALSYCDEAIVRFETENNKVALTMLCKAVCYTDLGSYENASELFKDSEQMAIKLQEPITHAFILFYKALTFFVRQGRFDESVALLDRVQILGHSAECNYIVQYAERFSNVFSALTKGEVIKFDVNENSEKKFLARIDNYIQIISEQFILKKDTSENKMTFGDEWIQSGDIRLTIERILDYIKKLLEREQLSQAETEARELIAKTKMIDDPWLICRTLFVYAWVRIRIIERHFDRSANNMESYIRDAYSMLDQSLNYAQQAKNIFYRFLIHYSYAYLASLKLDYSCDTITLFDHHMSQALTLAQTHGFEAWFRYNLIKIESSLLELALERNIEPIYVSHLLDLFHIEKNDLEATRSKDDDKHQTLPKSSQSALDDYPLTMKFFGHFCIYRYNEIVEEAEWRRKKGKSILKFLVAHEGKPVSVDQLVDTFWPEIEPEKGYRNLHVTVHFLRRLLEPSPVSRSESSHILHENGFFRFVPTTDCKVDIYDYQNLFRLAKSYEDEGQTENMITCYKQMIDMYGTGFLEDDLYEDWTESFRDQYKRMFIDTLMKVADYEESHGHFDLAVEFLNHILKVDPYDEKVHLQIMQIHLKKDNRNQAIRQYEKCMDLLRNELGIEPSSHLQDLYQKILQTDNRYP